jgi:RNA recognition motif-containing protein
MADQIIGRSRGFGFMEMFTQEIAEQTINTRPGKDFGGRILIVNEARPLEEK